MNLNVIHVWHGGRTEVCERVLWRNQDNRAQKKRERNGHRSEALSTGCRHFHPMRGHALCSQNRCGSTKFQISPTLRNSKPSKLLAMRHVVVLSPKEHVGVYSYDPDNCSTGAVAVASDNSVRPLPWSLDECAKNGLGFVMSGSLLTAKEILLEVAFARKTMAIDQHRKKYGNTRAISNLMFEDREAMSLVVDWLNLLSPQYPVQLQYGETCGRCSPFCVCLHVVFVCALIHSC